MKIYIKQKQVVKKKVQLKVGDYIEVAYSTFRENTVSDYKIESIAYKNNETVMYVLTNSSNTIIATFNSAHSMVYAFNAEMINKNTGEFTLAQNLTIKTVTRVGRTYVVTSDVNAINSNNFSFVYVADVTENVDRDVVVGDVIESARGLYTVEYVTNDGSVVAVDKKGKTCFISIKDADFFSSTKYNGVYRK
ncbi:hypothetical protein POP12_162 [Pectobacterium phage POP12]|nr:hypothetical protein POP12_162 [Pectobacterium phage POP12]